jgi:hypothetical protein
VLHAFCVGCFCEMVGLCDTVGQGLYGCVVVSGMSVVMGSLLVGYLGIQLYVYVSFSTSFIYFCVIGLWRKSSQFHFFLLILLALVLWTLWVLPVLVLFVSFLFFACGTIGARPFHICSVLVGSCLVCGLVLGFRSLVFGLWFHVYVTV